MRRCLRDPTSNHFSAAPTCDRQTVNNYGTCAVYEAYRASMAKRGKNGPTN